MLPPELLRLAQLHRLRQQQLARLAAAHAATVWERVQADDLSGSWDRVAGPAVLDAVGRAQAEAVRGVDGYVTTAVGMQGELADPAGFVNPGAFAGVASDGRTLDTLLGYPVFQVQAFVDGGMPIAQALGVGLRHLQRIVATQVQDAARVATGVAMIADRKVKGYVRVTTPPSCSRCVILAGKWYAHNAGFQRHPLCDCSQAPSTKEIRPQSPKELFEAMSPAELKQAGWSISDQKAIADGADMFQVTNARRALRSVTVAGQQLKTTLHGTTRRGLAGKRLAAARKSGAVRLTPESIYAEAQRLGWSRDETLAVLYQHGYLLSVPTALR